MSDTSPSHINLTGTGAAYFRVSSDKQEFKRQHDSLAAFEQRHKVKVSNPHRYEDHMPRDVSAKRPDFQRMLKEVNSRRLQWVFVDQIDRFGFADQWELVELLIQLRKSGCKLYDAHDEEWTTSDLMSFFKVGLAGHSSHDEQVKKSHRSLTGMVPRAKAGQWLGAPPRLGFDVGCFNRATGAEVWRVVWEGREEIGRHPKKKTRMGDASPIRRILRRKVYPDGKEERLDGEVKSFCTSPETHVMRIVPTRDKSKLDAAKGVFERYATEAVSLSELAKWLNDLGIHNSFGKMFQSNDIRRMIRDEVYLGYATFCKHRAGRFKRYDAEKGVIDIEPELRGKDTESEPVDIIRSNDRLFEPIIDRPTWDAVQKKVRARVKKTYAPKSPALYLAGLVVCRQCGLKMTSRTQGLEYNCTNWDRHRKNGQLPVCSCGRHGVKQSVIEPYLEKYLEESGRRLELLTGPPVAGERLEIVALETQQSSAWERFYQGVERLVEYLATQHPEEYDEIVRADDVRREVDKREWAKHRAEEENSAEKGARRTAKDHSLPAGTLLKRYGKKLADTATRAPQPDSLPVRPDDFVSALLDRYRANFDPDAVADELRRLDDQHTKLTKKWADLPTPRSKEKALGELRALEERISELEKQQEDVSATVLDEYRKMQDLAISVTNAYEAMKNRDGEQSLRQRAEALRSLLSRIECEFVVSRTRNLVTIVKGTHKGKRIGKGGPGQARSKLIALHFYPLVGDAMMLPVDDPEQGNARCHFTGFT